MKGQIHTPCIKLAMSPDIYLSIYLNKYTFLGQLETLGQETRPLENFTLRFLFLFLFFLQSIVFPSYPPYQPLPPIT